MGKIFQVLVLGIKGEKKTIDVAHSEPEFHNTTVASFREKIEEKIPELKGQNFKMLFTDVQLQDDETFSKYQIQDRSTVMLIVSLPGGQWDE
ncbi:uncharacterized protein zgc:194655 [Pygocentrus nattereri]|uniref:Ubiquitin-like domain-containing protein n=1 Tax=Pygocentrus nattereri TaxID=42514 RepID=A0A3B4CRU5_PYGNA|nr:uncharacterized protein zgc:194655 [Pygocentrus nattereri]